MFFDNLMDAFEFNPLEVGNPMTLGMFEEMRDRDRYFDEEIYYWDEDDRQLEDSRYDDYWPY